jgi:hypothetical protein
MIQVRSGHFYLKSFSIHTEVPPPGWHWLLSGLGTKLLLKQ